MKLIILIPKYDTSDQIPITAKIQHSKDIKRKG